MARRRRRGFVVIPPNRKTKWTCTIKGTDISDFILSASFPHGIITEELICEINLDNSGEDFTNLFAARDTIEFKMDFTDGTTVQFKGEVEEIKSAIEGGFFNLKIKGAHFTAQLLDVLVTKEFIGAKLSDIRTDLISTYLTGFTSTNVETNETTIDIKFVNKALLDCLIELDIQGDEDTYIDFDKDFHTFKRESKENLNIHFTPDDSLIQLRGLGTDSAEVRNKITVYGEVGDLPVIHVSEDSASQTTFRTKESVITDNTIIDEAQAKTVGDASQTQLKDPKSQGSVLSLFWTGINPGDKAYVISNPHKIHDLFRIVKFTFRVPEETLEVFFNQERSIPKLFKDRIRKEQGQERIVNPFNMTRSFNFTFDDESKIDSASSSNFTLEDGVLRKGSGETGIMISIKKDTDISANSMSLSIIGTELDGATYSFQADSQAEFQTISANSTSETSITTSGKEIKLKITITSANTRIDSAGLYWK